MIGFWTPLVSEKSNQVVYIWGWESYEERTKKNAAWRADPERAKKWAETEKDGPLVNRVYNQLMEPTAYSQMDRGEPYGPDASTRSPYIFELREYQAMPGKITNITDRFGNFTCDAFKKHGFRGRVLAQSHRRQRPPAHLPARLGEPGRAGRQVRHLRQGPGARACSARARRTVPSWSRWPHDPSSHRVLADEVKAAPGPGGGRRGVAALKTAPRTAAGSSRPPPAWRRRSSR